MKGGDEHLRDMGDPKREKSKKTGKGWFGGKLVRVKDEERKKKKKLFCPEKRNPLIRPSNAAGEKKEVMSRSSMPRGGENTRLTQFF